MKLKEQIYNCENCGSTISRNYNAVLNIKQETINQLWVTLHVVFRGEDTGRSQAIIFGACETSRSFAL
jgi:transposase